MKLHINDLFWTFQGEGANWGRRALFVRMPYCNLACSWCDTEYDSFKSWPDSEFVAFAQQEKARFAVITGGEPMMHKHTGDVIRLLLEQGFEIACETNGTYPIKPGIYFPTVSPKRDSGYTIHPHAFENAAEFKYVVDEGFPFEILKRHNVVDGRRYTLSPEYNRFHQSLAEIEQFIKETPGWRISLQTHKWMNVK